MARPPRSSVDLGRGLSLVLRGQPAEEPSYPADRIPKLLTLAFRGEDLTEEGVGFGLPILKLPRETFFPGSCQLLAVRPDLSRIEAVFELNLVETLERRGSALFESPVMRRVRELVALLHRELPPLRPLFGYLSRVSRAALGIATVFRPTASRDRLRVVYAVDAARGRLEVELESVELSGCPDARIIFMNEAGAGVFSSYTDSSGLCLEGEAIESWSPVAAERARFRDPGRGLYFGAARLPGAGLYRGREAVAGALSWAGLAQVLPPGRERFAYTIELGVEQ